jgi:hypothetical protein
MSKTLLESAADILAKSKSAAPAMPMEKPKGEVEDIGGPTNKNYKATDDSAKVTPEKSISKMTPPQTKPSDASPDTQLKMKKEEEELEGEVVAEEEVEEGIDLSEDVEAIFAEENLSEEFKAKVKTVFEARVIDRVSQIQEALEEEYAGKFEEAVAHIEEDLTEKVNSYLDYVVEEWMQENEVAVESGLRSELVEDFIVGMKNLFAEHYIDVPADKVDLVDELATKVEDLETKLNEEIQRGMEYKQQLVEARKAEIVAVVCDDLTDTQYEKIKSLAESVEFSTEEEFVEAVKTIRENYFPTGIKQADEQALNEQVEEPTGEQQITDPVMRAYAQTISKTLPR